MKWKVLTLFFLKAILKMLTSLFKQSYKALTLSEQQISWEEPINKTPSIFYHWKFSQKNKTQQLQCLVTEQTLILITNTRVFKMPNVFRAGAECLCRACFKKHGRVNSVHILPVISYQQMEVLLNQPGIVSIQTLMAFKSAKLTARETTTTKLHSTVYN